ncbi:hypothetical protein OUZ56_021144 [Daphnia magna]|uniref:Uncharacterized protein n=1 Tax=Daphnia magna TaxID=35525 RepID=A0ABQ9ZGI6_9CRUS|nr:hypothetical protein OUZ56_021144 [Daphnia magna]
MDRRKATLPLSLSPPSQSSVLIDLLTIVPPPTLKAIDIDFVTLDYYIVLNLDVLLWKIAIDVNSPCGFYGAAAAVKRSFISLLLPFVVIDPNPFTRIRFVDNQRGNPRPMEVVSRRIFKDRRKGSLGPSKRESGI